MATRRTVCQCSSEVGGLFHCEAILACSGCCLVVRGGIKQAERAVSLGFCFFSVLVMNVQTTRDARCSIREHTKTKCEVVVKCGNLELARALLPGSWLRPEGSRSYPPHTTCDNVNALSPSLLSLSVAVHHMTCIRTFITSAIRGMSTPNSTLSFQLRTRYHSPHESSSFLAAPPLPPDGFIALVPSVVGFAFCCATVPAAAKSSQKSFFS